MSDDWLMRLPDPGPGASVTTVPGRESEQVLSELGENAVRWAAAVGGAMAQRITDAIPDLGSNPAHFRLLSRGTTSTVLRSLLVVHRTAPDLTTTEAFEAARDFAHRGIPLSGILQGIRIGHSTMAEAFLRAAAEAALPEQRAEEMQRVSAALFAHIDDFAGAMEREFRHEYENRAAASAATRTQTVMRLLAGGDGAGDAGRPLGHPLRHRQLGVVAWTRHEPGAHADAVVRSSVAGFLEASGSRHTLLLPVGAGALWGWGTLPDGADLAAARAYQPSDGVEIAVGQAGDGVDGFRSTHHEARAVERLLRSADCSTTRGVTLHEDVALPILMSHDAPQARAFLRRVLGRLLDPDHRARETLATLSCYLDEGRSLARAAERLNVARNTVTYRLRRAEQLAGRSIGDSHLDLHAAVVLHRYLALG